MIGSLTSLHFELKASILHKAFSGDLVDQDAKNEPAHALLDRMRDEMLNQLTLKKKLPRGQIAKRQNTGKRSPNMKEKKRTDVAEKYPNQLSVAGSFGLKQRLVFSFLPEQHAVLPSLNPGLHFVSTPQR